MTVHLKARGNPTTSVSELKAPRANRPELSWQSPPILDSMNPVRTRCTTKPERPKHGARASLQHHHVARTDLWLSCKNGS